MSVIDFHTHILPFVDDGSDSLETSLEMLRMLNEQGVKRVVATPHFYANHDLPENFLEKRAEAKNKFLKYIEAYDNLPDVSVGAEVYFFEGISVCEYLSDMAIENTKYIMVEMPFKHWSDRNLQELAGIYQKRGLTPIIAHIDRYIRPFGYKKLFDRLENLPVIIQVNASFFTNKATRRFALSLFRQGRIQLIGSDCHNLTSRKPNISEALQIIERFLGNKAISHINYFEHKIISE